MDGLDASNAKGVLTRFALQDQPLSEPINDQILANFKEGLSEYLFNTGIILVFMN